MLSLHSKIVNHLDGGDSDLNLKLCGVYLGVFDLGNRLCVKLVFEVELALDIYMQ